MEPDSIHQSRTSKGKAGYITRVEELAYEVKIEAVMTREVKMVAPSTPMMEVLELLRKARISGAPVVLEGQLVGIISIEDLLCALRDFGQAELKATVADYMTREVITVKAFDPLIEALWLFAKTRVGRLPVIDEVGQLVGMITKGDVTRGLLNALQHEYQVKEVRRYQTSRLFEDVISDQTVLVLRYQVKPRDFTHGGTASSHIKKALLRLGLDPQFARRCGIAVYEAEMNLVIHTTHGGEIKVEIEPHQILLKAIDDGPGIEDIELVMQLGYSTAPEEIRALGFGAGMGLKNIERCVDEMQLESTVGEGTRLVMKIGLHPEKP
jgi:CBS domain-containing protein/anti-sigma regulatory factor (Ser/Thr protein kinase)